VTVFDRSLVRALPLLPRRAVRRFASPYIAGTTLDDACRVVERLNAAGKSATVDVLGEEVGTLAEAEQLTQAYLDVFDAIRERRLDANVSVKPTGLALKVDPAACRGFFERLVARAESDGGFVRIDMEDATTTDATFDLFRALRAAGREPVGVVLQARLRRTLDDVFALAPLAPSVRLCKGIYLEPDQIAFTSFHEIRAAYVRAAEALLDCVIQGSGSRVAFATHDDHLIAEVKRLAAARGLAPGDVEFQMLLGVRERAGDALVAEGYRVRVYVPYGERWYEYSLRRLQENPRIATAVAADTVLRAVPGGRR
jgi:proline dehydrogenase